MVESNDSSELLDWIREAEREKEALRAEVWRSRRRPSRVASLLMMFVGVLCLGLSIFYGSLPLAFIGLGLTFWGALLSFVRGQNYVRLDLLIDAMISPLEAINGIVRDYEGKGQYFLSTTLEPRVYIHSQKNGLGNQSPEQARNPAERNGIVIVPPGLGLVDLFERELHVKFDNCRMESLPSTLAKLLIEDLELATDFTMESNGGNIHFRFTESPFIALCLRLARRRFLLSVGCPLCSAMGCVLLKVTRRPFIFNGCHVSSDGRNMECSYLASYCPRCFASLQDYDKFCWHCGLYQAVSPSLPKRAGGWEQWLRRVILTGS